MLCQFQGEGEVGITEDSRIRQRVNELEPAEPANCAHTGRGWHCIDGLVLVLRLIRLGLGDDVVEAGRAVVVAQHVAEALVAQSAELLVGHHVELPLELERREHIDLAATRQLPLLHLLTEPGQELRGRLPHVELVGRVVALVDLLQLLQRLLLQHVLHHHVRHQAPLDEQLLDLRHLGLGHPVGHLALLGAGLRVVVPAQQPLEAEGPLHGVLQVLVHLDAIPALILVLIGLLLGGLLSRGRLLHALHALHALQALEALLGERLV
mmetsp:Transcript_26382/g.36031  ORF Transcript_26382/g.36031 Transcript_26382/m.36031 type:complete len:266 (-) Transcript_26382:49-846(-)